MITQDDINLMMSHINSYKRKKLNDRSPISVFSFLYGTDILQKLAVEDIPSNEIILLPTLPDIITSREKSKTTALGFSVIVRMIISIW